MKGFMHITNDEAILVNVIIVDKNKISKLDDYVGYMELTNGKDVMVYNVDGILKGYIID
jgi:hypothetical protein